VFGELLIEYQRQKNARRRKIYVFSFTTSAVLIGTLIIGAIIYALFNIEDLPPPAVAVTFFAAAPPPPPPPPPARKRREQPKPKPVVQPTIQQVKSALVQPKQKDPEPEPDKEPEDHGVEGGVEGGVPGGVVGGVLGGEKDNKPPPPPPPKPVEPPKPKVVQSTVLESQKLSGGIPPLPPNVKEQAFTTLGNQPGMLTAIFKVCLGTDGAISSINMMKPSGSAALDDFIRANLRTWRYRPYMIDGKPTPICGTKVFNINLQ
jgi:periplasmic protein TonB